MENLLFGRFEAFAENPAFERRLPQIRAHFRDTSLQVRAVLVYSGLHVVADDRLRLFEDLKQRVSPGSDYFVFQPYNLTSVHDWLTGADEGPGVREVEITLLKPAWVLEPYETLYGLVNLSDLATLAKSHGKRLLAANLRQYKGATEVNNSIMATIRDEPHYFFYLNNGLTAYCERVEVNNLDRGNTEQKRLKAYGFSIVNGAQTLGSVDTFFTANPNSPSQGSCSLKIISLERCVDDVGFAQRITRSTNFQNEIGSRDFAALDDQQERIALQLQLSGVNYHYKDADDIPEPDTENFTLDEATTAIACLEQENECDLCSRVLASRRSLWSFEEVYAESMPFRSRYGRLFRPDRSARTIWRAVQTQRVILDRMRANARSSTGIRKAFFENARWLVLNIVFLQLRPEQGEVIQLSEEEIMAAGIKAIEVAEIIWEVAEAQGLVGRRAGERTGPEPYEQTRHFRSVFCSAPDCQRLRNGALAKLAEHQASRSTV